MVERLGPGQLPCPYCGHAMSCDEVDVGVGWVQCGPYHCDVCEASEMGPEQVRRPYPRPLTQKEQAWWDSTTEEEREHGMYKGGRISPYANTVAGKLVNHQTAKTAYRRGLLDPKPKD